MYFTTIDWDLKINNRMKFMKSLICGNKHSLNNQGVKLKSHKGYWKYFDNHEEKNITYQNLGDATKGVLRENFTVVNANVQK